MKKKKNKMFNFSIVVFMFAFILLASPLIHNVRAEENENKEIGSKEKIIHYNAKTGEKEEVNLENIKEIVKNKYKNIPNYTRQYKPKKVKNLSLLSEIKSTDYDYTWISSYDIDPYRQVCRIRYSTGSSGDEQFIDYRTGFMVGPNLLLTLQFNIFNPHDPDYIYKEWSASPGYNNGTSYNNLSATYTDIYYIEQEYVYDGPENDWCLCVLDKPIGNQTGWIGTSYYNMDSMGAITILADGYPTRRFGTRRVGRRMAICISWTSNGILWR